MATCPESDLTTFASDGLPGFHESYSLKVSKLSFRIARANAITSAKFMGELYFVCGL